MTKEAALYGFWASFGLPAYDEASVPTGDNAPKFPYITYQVSTSDFGDPVALSASLWYRSTSWVDANAKAQEVGKMIGRGGVTLHYDGGAMWIKRGSPFAQSMGDPSDNLVSGHSDGQIKRKIINIEAEFISAD